MKTSRVTTICRLALFLAIEVVLSYVESFIPLPIPLPGVRLGLANAIGLVVLYFYSPKEFVGIGFLRVLIVGLLRSTAVSFALSFTGWALSTLMVLLFYFWKKASIYGLSICSAVFHGLGQVLMVMLIYQLPDMINYLPVMLFSGIISGALVAMISALAMKNLEHVLK